MKRIIFSNNAWEEYLSWQNEDKRMLKKINALMKDIPSNPFTGTGKPEPLKFELQGLWSRIINSEHRLVYQVEGKELIIYSCRYHLISQATLCGRFHFSSP